MDFYLTHTLIHHLIIFQVVVLFTILSNTWILYHSRLHPALREYPSVSILVPARNEEKIIARCVRSLLEQDYPNYEVFVLDDQSNDGTLAILEKMASSHQRLHVLKGQPLPENFLGKSWACAQLAEQAPGELLFFTDADTIHRPQALRIAVTTMIGEDADLLSGFPRQVVKTCGEQLIVPFFLWAFYCFTPLGLAYRLKLPALSNAVGQMLLFRRSAYQMIGGHTSVQNEIVEDLALARRIISAGLRWRVINATDLITCRMYTNNKEAIAGFSKNLFAAFNDRLLPYLFVFTWLMVMFWEPLAVSLLYILGLAPFAQPAALVACLSLSLLIWLIPYNCLGFPLALAGLYPITILVNSAIGFRSLWLSLTGRLTWKDRPIKSVRLRWF